MSGTDIKWYPGKVGLCHRTATRLISFLILIQNIAVRPQQEEVKGRKRPLEDPPSFFCWFADSETMDGDEIAEIIKDDIWPNPMQYFLVISIDLFIVILFFSSFPTLRQ